MRGKIAKRLRKLVAKTTSDPKRSRLLLKALAKAWKSGNRNGMILVLVLAILGLGGCLPDIDQAKQDILSEIAQCNSTLKDKLNNLCVQAKYDDFVELVCPDGPSVLCWTDESAAHLCVWTSP